MPLHLKRLCVGCESIENLQAFQDRRLAQLPDGRLFTFTRMVPRRAKELVDGGSLYWIIKGVMRVRQAILDVEVHVDEEGRRYCLLIIDPTLVAVKPRPHRAFQGWRYFKDADVPSDLDATAQTGDALPDPLADELRDLGLL